MTGEMKALVAPLGVSTFDAEELRRRHPARILNGWELKVYALVHTQFRHVLLLDADNVPVIDPTFLFDDGHYHDSGAIFWPDFGRLAPDRRVWDLMGLEHEDEPEFESGQLVIDKCRCWKPLLLAMWMNEYSDFWYRHIHGDKETFHLAWKRLGSPYAMPSKGIAPLSGVMCQHDFEGRRIFQHRNMAKWSFEANQRVQGFLFEDLCITFIRDLARRWRPSMAITSSTNDADLEVAQRLSGQLFQYVRVGYDARPLRLGSHGVVKEGAAAAEVLWWIESGKLLIAREDGRVTCRLHPRRDGIWSGAWLDHEQMPILLKPIPTLGCTE